MEAHHKLGFSLGIELICCSRGLEGNMSPEQLREQIYIMWYSNGIDFNTVYVGGVIVSEGGWNESTFGYKRRRK